MPPVTDTRLGRLALSQGWSEVNLQVPEAWPTGPAAERLLGNGERGFQPIFFVAGGMREMIVLESPQPALPSYAEMLGLYRDFTPGVSALLEAASAYAAEGEHLLLVDPEQFYLYDLDRREPLLYGHTPEEWKSRLAPLLASDGSPRQAMERLPRREPQQLAHHLGRFLDSFRKELGAASKAAEERIERFTLQLLLSAFYTLREPREIAPPVRTFWETFLAGEAQPLPTRPLLEAISRTLDQLYRRFSLRLFHLDRGAETFEQQWCFSFAEQPAHWLWEQLAGFMQQMPTKFSGAIFETCLLDPEDARRSLQQALRETASFYKTLERDGAVVFKPIEIDVPKDGLGWGLEILRGCLDLMESERTEQQKRLKRYGSTGQTLDLFQSASAGADSRGVVEDPVMTVLSDALRWTGIAAGTAQMRAEFLAAVNVWEWLWDPEHPERQRYHASMAALPRLVAALPQTA